MTFSPGHLEFTHCLVSTQILTVRKKAYSILEQSRAYANAMPHPLHAVAGDRMVYSIPLIIFQDDVSGNQSKQWNKHYSCYMSNGAVPRTKLDGDFQVRFIATSPHATPLELMEGIRGSIEYVLPFHYVWLIETD